MTDQTIQNQHFMWNCRSHDTHFTSSMYPNWCVIF